MKQVFFVVLVVIIFYNSLSAQEVEKKQFVYGGIGTLSAPEVVSKFIDIWLTNLSAGYTSSDTKSKVPAVSLGYQFYGNHRFSFGGSITYESLVKDISYRSRYAGNTEATFVSTMLELRYEYVQNEDFGMFFDLGIGPCFVKTNTKYDDKSENLDKTMLSLQFNPIGLRFGNKFLVHLGLGFGMKGLLTASMGYKF